MRKRGAGRGINDGRREDIPYYIIYRGAMKNGTDAGSESRGNAFTLPSVSRFKTTESD